MFSQGAPVLAGIDLDSGYLFLLSHVGACDGPRWAAGLKETKDQEMEPKCVVKEGAKGVELSFDKIGLRDDAFHAIYLATKARLKLEPKAYSYIGDEEKA